MQVCPENTKSLNFVDHQLRHSNREIFAKHLQECEECTTTVNQLKEDFTLIEMQIPVQAPDKSTTEEFQSDLRDRLKSLYQANEEGMKQIRKIRWKTFVGEKLQRLASVTGIF